MSEKPLRIMLADDHEIVRRGVRTLLQTVPGWEVVCEASNGEAAVEEAILCRPDVLLLDISMPPTDGLDVARRLHDAGLETRILVFTMHDSEEMVRDFLAAGVHGYVLKSDADRYLVTAIETLANGKRFFSHKVSETILTGFLQPRDGGRETSNTPHPLSRREMEIAKLLALGKSNKEVAVSLFISVKTVETHRRTIMQKLDISSVVELVHWAIRNGVIEPGK
jgi:DNA-binding NarL/FixJ family response regulator